MAPANNYGPHRFRRGSHPGSMWRRTANWSNVFPYIELDYEPQYTQYRNTANHSHSYVSSVFWSKIPNNSMRDIGLWCWEEHGNYDPSFELSISYCMATPFSSEYWKALEAAQYFNSQIHDEYWVACWEKQYREPWIQLTPYTQKPLDTTNLCKGNVHPEEFKWNCVFYNAPLDTTMHSPGYERVRCI